MRFKFEYSISNTFWNREKYRKIKKKEVLIDTSLEGIIRKRSLNMLGEAIPRLNSTHSKRVGVKVNLYTCLVEVIRQTREMT